LTISHGAARGTFSRADALAAVLPAARDDARQGVAIQQYAATTTKPFGSSAWIDSILEKARTL